jgi:hypothetical protein
VPAALHETTAVLVGQDDELDGLVRNLSQDGWQLSSRNVDAFLPIDIEHERTATHGASYRAEL